VTAKHTRESTVRTRSTLVVLVAAIGHDMAQSDHEQEMMNGDSAGMHHGNTDAITVEPGKTGSLTHTFKTGEDVLIGCHQPGHYAGGMKLTVATG
jgi:uncharacterized cupredoxin-like copper-binding protein